ncbi:MAG: dockerin type I repeat-containing protein [Acidobacteriota bacterium]|nr:dockerin type I repeat-containing protein [Acidobacteriota bacterium]
MKKNLLLSIVFLALLFPVSSSIVFGSSNNTCGSNVCGTCCTYDSNYCCACPNPVGGIGRCPSSLAGTNGSCPTENSGGTTMIVENPTKTFLSSLFSIFILIVGLWTLLVMLRWWIGEKLDFARALLPVSWRNRFNKLKPIVPVFDFVMKPSVSFSVLTLLFAAAVVSNIVTPPTITAQKRKIERMSLNTADALTFQSAVKIGGNNKVQITAPVFDSAGNMYIAGGFTGSMFVGADELSATSNFDMFVAKYEPDQDGGFTPVWARMANGVLPGTIDETFAIEGAASIAVDAAGNVYLGGAFVEKLSFREPDGGVAFELDDSTPVASGLTHENKSATNGINYEPFVAKLNASGDWQWAKGGATNSPQNPNDLKLGANAVNKIVADGAGNVYVAGYVSGDNFLGASITGGGATDILLAKLDAATGNPVWVKTIGGSGADEGTGLDIVGGAVFLLTRFHSDSITFGAGATFTNNKVDPNQGGSIDTAIAKYDTDGTFQFARQLGNQTIVAGNGLTGNGNDVYVTGEFRNSFDIQLLNQVNRTVSNPYDAQPNHSASGDASLGGFVLKMTANNGTFEWIDSFGGAGAGIALGADGVYVTGTYWAEGIFAGVPSLFSYGPNDQFVARWNFNALPNTTNADLKWAKSMSSSSVDSSNALDASQISLKYRPLGLFYNPQNQSMNVAGDFAGTMALDCTVLSAPTNARNAYVARLGDPSTGSCRVWKGAEASNTDWTNSANWSGATVPTVNSDVYIPFNSYFMSEKLPDNTPNTTLNSLTIGPSRTLLLPNNLSINNQLTLLGSNVNVGNNALTLENDADVVNELNNTGTGGYVIGNLSKKFASVYTGFTFPVGTATGYSPVIINEINTNTNGILTVRAVDGVHPALSDQSTAVKRFWTLGGSGLNVDLQFIYGDDDVQGNESLFKLFKINNGIAEPCSNNLGNCQGATVDTVSNSASINNVSSFSDWAIAGLPASANAAGTAIYGTNLSKVVPGVTLTVTGGSSASTVSNLSGEYLLANLPTENNYTITPSKSGDRNGITAFDATLVLRCVAAGNNCALTNNQRQAANTDGDGGVTAFDATQILRYVAANGPNANTGQVGNWKFDPISRSYIDLGNSVSGQNYTAFLIGEVDGDWTSPAPFAPLRSE